MEPESYRQIFEKKTLDIRFHGNLFRGMRVRCGQTDMKPLFSFRNFANAPDKQVAHFRRRVISFFVTGDVMDSRFLLDTFHRT